MIPEDTEIIEELHGGKLHIVAPVKGTVVSPQAELITK
jgi:hypothetical protein